MVLKLTNNATTTLAASINAAVTSLSIVAGDAGKFPVLAAGDWFPVTVVDNAGNMEVMRCTARAGGSLTVTRAQEGTTAKAFVAGSRVDVRLTVAALNDIYDTALAAKQAAGTVSDALAALSLAVVYPSRVVSAGVGLLGGGDLSGDRSFSVKYGTSAGTAAEGDDSRIVNAVPNTRSLTAGNGLSGGGALSANRSFALGTPGKLTAGTGNTVGAETHFHEVDHADITSKGNAALGLGAVGTYAMLWNTANEIRNPGTTRAGSTLEYCNANAQTSGTSPPGTWRLMGYCYTGAGTPRASQWLRIS
jgi:hypothetical protein